jgi:hypothetical protein
MRNTKDVEVTVEHKHGDKKEVHSHDAFGTISMTVRTGGSGVLFGSDVIHNQTVCISIQRAELTRNLSNDWIHDEIMPIIEIHLSHSQFSEFITSQGRGEGTPCTITHAPERGTKTHSMPGINKIETKAETFRREIHESTHSQLDKLRADVAAIGKELESPSLSKKRMKELHRNLEIVMGNMPSNMAFVVEQCEEALEKATTSAKIEVEAFIGQAINRLGMDAAKQIGLVPNDDQTKLIK